MAWLKVFFSESAEISYCFETFTFTGLSFKWVRKIRPAINWDNQTSSSDLMAIECFPIGGNIPLLYPFLLKAIYVLENIIQLTSCGFCVLRLKFVTSCGFLRKAFYLLALWMFLQINRNLTSFERLCVLAAQELLAPLLARALFLGCKYCISFHRWFIPYGNIGTHKWPAPNVSGFIAQLVRASHRYHEVTRSNPVEVLNFSGFFTQLQKLRSYSCNCKDHSFSWFHIRSSYNYDPFHISFHRWFIPYGNVGTHKWPAPNVSGFIAQLVRASHRYRKVTGWNPVEVLNFSGFFTQLQKLRS